MRSLNRLLVPILALLVIPSASVIAQVLEDAAIGETIEHYFQGYATGNGEHFKKAST